MSENTSLTRAGITLAVAALLTAIVAAATSLLLTSRLSDEDALLADMDTIITTVSDEAVANTESFLRPATQTADFLSSFVVDDVLDPKSLDAEILLFDVLRSNPSFDGIYVGSDDGGFVYVNRLANDPRATYASKRISTTGEREVKLTTYDRALNVLSTELDPSDTFDPRTRTWYRAAANTEAGAWTDPYLFFSSLLPGVTRSAPAMIGGRVQHVIGVDMRIAELSDFMAERAPSPNGAAFLMTREQQMVAYPDLGEIGDGSALRFAYQVDDTALALAGATIEEHFSDADQMVDVNGKGGLFNLDGRNAHFVFTPLETNKDWVLTAWSPHSDFLAEVRGTAQTNRLIALGLGGVILVELLVAAVWVYRRLVTNHQLLIASEEASKRSSIERARAETALAATVDQLASSNRELEQYAYAAAHDLRTPLRAIGGYSELIEREVESDEADLTQVREWASQIVVGYDRMGRTMDNLLEHARRSRLGLDIDDLERVDIRTIASAVASDLTAALHAANGTVRIGELPLALGDPVQLARVFQNLLENAIRFRDRNRGLEIEIAGKLKGDDVCIRVSDNGVGFAGGDKSRIFESFHSAHDDSAGLGLGLALVKRIVEDHGGQIHAESVVGHGSVFEFTLPSVERASIDGRT